MQNYDIFLRLISLEQNLIVISHDPDLTIPGALYGPSHTCFNLLVYSLIIVNGNTAYKMALVRLPMIKRLTIVVLIILSIHHDALSKGQSGAGGALASAQSILYVNSFETFSSDCTDMDGFKSWTK